MDVDSQCNLSILHVSTVVTNGSGDTFIKGFFGTSLGIKLEVDISTCSLMNTVNMVEPVEIDSPNSVLPPLDINRHTKVVKQVGKTMRATTRDPLVMPLVGSTNVTPMRFDEESDITMATEHLPLALYWLTVIIGFYENRGK